MRGPQEMDKMERNQMHEGRDNRGMGRTNQKKNVIEGKVTAVNDKVFTVEQNGQSKNFQISDSTRFPIDSANKVAVGDTVIISGEQDSNETIQATRIIVNPSNNK